MPILYILTPNKFQNYSVTQENFIKDENLTEKLPTICKKVKKSLTRI